MRSALEMLPLGDLRAELTLDGALGARRAAARSSSLMKIVQKDGDRFPELVAEVHERIIAPGHAQAVRCSSACSASWHQGRDPRAIAAVALGSLVAYRIEETMFGSPPGGSARTSSSRHG